MQRIAVLGSTGSIGTQTLEVCQQLGYSITALCAHKNSKRLEEQAREYHPRYVIVTDPAAYRDLKVRLADLPVRLLSGEESLCEAAALPENERVVNALVGMTGLRPTLAALAAGHDVAIANKETLVAAGKLVTETAAQHGAALYPVDSEHSAIFQCLQGNRLQQVRRLILTASGGPFFGKSHQELQSVTLKEALRHPNWNMGVKVTVDSSTLMNKGLELIEAMWLFGLPPEQIDIVVHRQSVIHSLVEYQDGSVMAQLGAPDMRLPIQYALTWPERLPSPARRLSLADCGPLTFALPDVDTFVCLKSCIQAARMGGLAPCLVNGANEAAVELFIAGRISFLQIGELVSRVLDSLPANDYTNLQQVLEADRAAREFVYSQL